MKKSIILAFFIFLITVGWLASGQLGKVNAQDDKKITNTETDENPKSVILEEIEDKKNIFKVETKFFKSEQIDQSIILQGQTIHNKKVDVKSETTGNITRLNFKRGDKVLKDDSLLNISLENRQEILTSVDKNIERLKKELIINQKK